MKCGVFLLNLVSAEDDSVSRKQDHRYHRGNPFILFLNLFHPPVEMPAVVMINH